MGQEETQTTDPPDFRSEKKRRRFLMTRPYVDPKVRGINRTAGRNAREQNHVRPENELPRARWEDENVCCARARGDPCG